VKFNGSLINSDASGINTTNTITKKIQFANNPYIMFKRCTVSDGDGGLEDCSTDSYTCGGNITCAFPQVPELDTSYVFELSDSTPPSLGSTITIDTTNLKGDARIGVYGGGGIEFVFFQQEGPTRTTLDELSRNHDIINGERIVKYTYLGTAGLLVDPNRFSTLPSTLPSSLPSSDYCNANASCHIIGTEVYNYRNV
jgi:hypothetical protein